MFIMKRKKAALAFLLVGALVLCSCGKRRTEEEDREIVRVSVILPHDDDGYWILIQDGIQQTGDKLEEEYGFDVNVIMPQLNYNIPQMVDLLEQQIAAQTDVLVVQGNDDAEYISTLKKAWNQGIQIVLVDTDIEDFPDHLYIGSDNYEAGKLLGEQLIRITGGTSRVAVVSGEPGYSNLEERLNGLKDAVKDYPDIQLGAVRYDHYDGLTVRKLYYSLADQADTIVFLEGTGGVTLSSQFSTDDRIYSHLLGFDAYEGVFNGVLDGIVKQNTFGMGKKVVEEIAEYVQTGSYSKDNVYTDVQWVTQENCEEIISDREREFMSKKSSGGEA